MRTLPLRYYAVPVKVGLHQGAEDPIESLPINKLVEVGQKTRKVQKKMEPADDFFYSSIPTKHVRGDRWWLKINRPSHLSLVRRSANLTQRRERERERERDHLLTFAQSLDELWHELEGSCSIF